MRTAYLGLTVVSFLWAPIGSAQEVKVEAPNVFSLGVKGGIGLPQLNSSLETTFYVHVELAYQFPFWGSRLGLLTAVGYSQPKASGLGTSPQLPDEAFSWEMTQRQTTWDLGLTLKFMPQETAWNIGLLAGSRLMFLSTLTNGEAGGQAFGEHDEQATVPGLLAGVQVEIRAGPGVFFAEMSLATAFEDLRTTGEVALAEVGILAGYRFAFVF